jgi:hypothetical protein
MDLVIEFVFKHIIAASIGIPIMYRSEYEHLTIDHRNNEMGEIINRLPFCLDDFDYTNMEFLPCFMCFRSTENVRCGYCENNGKLYSLRNFQHSVVFIRYLYQKNISKTYFRETAALILNSFCSDKNYFGNWLDIQKRMLYTCLLYIYENWDDFEEYNMYYVPTLDLDNLRFSFIEQL